MTCHKNWIWDSHETQGNPAIYCGEDVIREKGAAELQTIGAGALNQAVKALAIARGFMAPSGVDLICRPAFTDVEVDEQERTAIRLMIEPK